MHELIAMSNQFPIRMKNIEKRYNLHYDVGKTRRIYKSIAIQWNIMNSMVLLPNITNNRRFVSATMIINDVLTSCDMD